MSGATEADPDRTQFRPAAAEAEPPPEPALHLLLLEEEGAPPRHFPLGPVPLRIGRVAGNDVVLASPEVSRAHCLVALEGDAALVTDLGATNGTLVDGVRIAGPTPLAPGARLRIGPFTLHYQRGDRRVLEHAVELDRDLERAGHYVAALLPDPIAEGPVRADWRFIPSARIGGDAFGFGPLDTTRFHAWLLDVAGHGAGAALLAASAMNLLRDHALPGADPREPRMVLAALNRAFQMDRHGGLYFTIWYGVYDSATRTLRYGAAGQHPGFLTAPGHARAVPLWTRNPPIGVVPDRPFAAAAVTVRPGARLLLFSDGAFETQAPDGSQRGLADILPLLPRPDGATLPEPERLWRAVRAASRPGPFEDDVAILALDFM